MENTGSIHKQVLWVTQWPYQRDRQRGGMVKFLFFLSLFSLADVLAAEVSNNANDISLLCIAEQSIGFSYNEARDKWEAALFDVSDDKYTFRKSQDGTYQFVEFGERYPLVRCSGINAYGFGICSDSLHDLTINVKSLRYQLIYPVGYAVAPSRVDQPGDTPSIEIGKCTEL